MKRVNYIGGGDAAAVLGKNRYDPIIDVWQRKVDMVDRNIDNADIQRGFFMEPLIEDYVRENIDPSLNSFENFARWDAFPDKEDDDQIFLQHAEYEYIGGHPDGVGDEIIHEFKAPRSHTVDKIKREGINPRYFYQIQHYLWITGLPLGMLHVWDYDAHTVYSIDVVPNPSVHAIMEQRYVDFWWHVQCGIQPQYDEIELQQEFDVVEDADLEKWLLQYMVGTRRRYGGKDMQEEAKGKILSRYRGANRIITPNFQCHMKYNVGKYNYTRLTVKRRNQDFAEDDD